MSLISQYILIKPHNNLLTLMNTEQKLFCLNNKAEMIVHYFDSLPEFKNFIKNNGTIILDNKNKGQDDACSNITSYSASKLSTTFSYWSWPEASDEHTIIMLLSLVVLQWVNNLLRLLQKHYICIFLTDIAKAPTNKQKTHHKISRK